MAAQAEPEEGDEPQDEPRRQEDPLQDHRLGHDRELDQDPVAAVGFALTAYPIGVERGYVPRAQARDRVLKTLRFFHDSATRAGVERGDGFQRVLSITSWT